jgi:hypothetical protein
MGEHYPQLRRYAPALIEILQLRPAPVARELIKAVEVLRKMNREALRKVPQYAPLGFIRRRWEAYVFGPEGIDRRFYELCVMAELKNSLQSGDVSVAGSRQFRDFEDYLMPHPEFDRRLTQGELHVAVPTTAAAYIEERVLQLRSALDQTNALAREDQLPDAELNSAGLELNSAGFKISPLENSVPKEAEALRDALSSMLPHVKITDLLMEVDRCTGFTRHFAHLKTNGPVKDPTLLLTAILADATNLGLGKMAESCPGTSPAKLSWLVAWHIRDQTYSKALAEIVNHQHHVPFAANWGEGTTSSSDGQRYRAGGRGEAGGRVNDR